MQLFLAGIRPAAKREEFLRSQPILGLFELMHWHVTEAPPVLPVHHGFQFECPDDNERSRLFAAMKAAFQNNTVVQFIRETDTNSQRKALLRM